MMGAEKHGRQGSLFTPLSLLMNCWIFIISLSLQVCRSTDKHHSCLFLLIPSLKLFAESEPSGLSSQHTSALPASGFLYSRFPCQSISLISYCRVLFSTCGICPLDGGWGERMTLSQGSLKTTRKYRYLYYDS